MDIVLCDNAVFNKYQIIYMFDNIKAFTHWMHFSMQIICTKNIFWTADLAWIFSHKMQISCSEKAILLFFFSRSILHWDKTHQALMVVKSGHNRQTPRLRPRSIASQKVLLCLLRWRTSICKSLLSCPTIQSLYILCCLFIKHPVWKGV